MATYTTYYNLPKPAGTDQVSPIPYNNGMDILDALLHANLPIASVIAALSTYTGQTIPSDANINDLFSAIASNTRVQIATGSYTGTGTYGSENPNSFAVGFVPKLLVVSKHYDTQFYGMICIISGSNVGGFYAYSSGTNASYITQISNTTNAGITLTSADTTQWYANSAAKQLNESGVVYDVLAIG